MQALGTQRIKKHKVEDETSAETWMSSKKQHEINSW